MIAAGTLRHSIRVQSLVETVDAGGGRTRAWVDYFLTHAAITPMSGRELRAGGQMQAPMTHRLTLRWAPGLTAKMRVLFGTRVFNVRAVRNLDERNRWVELLCEEGVAQ